MKTINMRVAFVQSQVQSPCGSEYSTRRFNDYRGLKQREFYVLNELDSIKGSGSPVF